jgi:multimeric flavodoxin WrbA
MKIPAGISREDAESRRRWEMGSYIIGISGSPRKANTEYLVSEALAAAGDMAGTRTRLISLADHDLRPCESCLQCMGHVKGSTESHICCNHGDADPIIREMMIADGIIMGTPVYTWNVSGRLKCLMEKCTPLCPFPMTEISYRLSNKVLGAIAVAGGIWEGQELAVQAIWRWGLSLGMTAAGAITTEPLPTSCISAGMASGTFSSSVFAEDSTSPDSNQTLRRYQINSCKNLGRNVAYLARVMKTGIAELEKSGVPAPEITGCKRAPQEPAPGSHLDRLVKSGRMKPARRADRDF